MRFCKSCGQTKPLEEFVKSSKKKDGRGYKCIPCARVYQTNYYRDNESAKRNVRKHAKATKDRNRLFVRKYLEKSKCVDCGIDDADVLEFDHIDPSDKRANISVMIKRNSLEVLQQEIDKCAVRCCNCHRKRTIKQFGWYLFCEPA